MEFKIVHNRIWSDVWANTRLRIIKKILEDRGKLILDLGCGNGYVGLVLAQHNKVVFAEIDDKLIKNIKGMKVILDANQLPFKKDIFDFIICADVLEHIRDDKKVLQNIYDVLKKGGRATIALPAYSNLYGHHDKLIGHYRRYDKKTFLSLARKTGFKIKYTRYCLSLLFFPFLINQFIFESDKIYMGSSKFEMRLLPLLNLVAWVESSLRLPFGINLLVILEK